MDRPRSTPLRELRPHPSSNTRASVTLGRRRNGKLQSCEPCRKSKLRCDHSVPCSRCLRRRIADQCVFHPAPLSKVHHIVHHAPDQRHLVTPTSSTTATPVSEHTSLSEAPRQDHLPTVISPACSRPDVLRTASPASSASSDADERLLHNDHNPGYVGVTSYSDIFADAFADLTADTDEAHKCKHQAAVTEKNLARSCEVLAFFQHRTLIDDFIEHFHRLEEDSGLIGKPIMETWRKGFWEIHGEVLQRQDPAEIRKLATLVWDNSHIFQPVTPDMTTRQYAERDTGHGIRWVTIGALVAMVGICAQQVLETHELFRRHGIERRRLLSHMSELTHTCLEFHRQTKIIDLRLAWLLIAVSLMPDANKSDFSYASYRESGELNDVVITMGLHQPPRAGTPLFFAELRKRTYLVAYAREISTATFLGRPPRLSHRYSTVPPPLDITDEELFLDPPELAKVIAGLDPQGFNRKGHFQRSTYMRAWAYSTGFREEILDLGLGKYTPEQVIAGAARIERELREMWSLYPPVVSRIFTEKVSTLLAGGSERNLTPLQTLLQYSIRHALKSMELLLQLILIRKASCYNDNTDTAATTTTIQDAIKPDTMIRIASEILTGTLEISQDKRMLYNFPQDVTSLLGNQGLRAAAILGVELLKQEQRLHQQKNGANGPSQQPRAPSEQNLLLPRSRTIQNLAVFASRLEAVDPADGMAAICAQGKKVIGRILDKLLTPEFYNSNFAGCGATGVGGSSNSNDNVFKRPVASDLVGVDVITPRQPQQHNPSTYGTAQTPTPSRGGEARSGPVLTTVTPNSLHIPPQVLALNSSSSSSPAWNASSTTPALTSDASISNTGSSSSKETPIPSYTPVGSGGSTSNVNSPGGMSQQQQVTSNHQDPSSFAGLLPASTSTSAKPEDMDLWSFVYGTTEAADSAPILGYDHDFMAWLESMDFDDGGAGL